MLEKTLNLLRAWKRKIEHYINIIYNIFHNRINTKYIDSIELHIARSAKNAQIYDCHPQSWIKLQHKEQEVVLFDKRFSDRKEFRLFREISWYISRATHIFYLPNFRICGENGFIVSTDGYICKQFTYPIRSRRWAITDFLGQGRLKSSTVATGWYTTLAAPTAYNYFHWMLECLPRMAILEKYVEIFDGIVIPANPSPFHLESLTALGICPKKLVATSPTINIQAEHLFVTDYSARDNPPPWLHVWYKEKFIQKIVHDVSTIQKHHFRKIYISRNDASQRKVTNHAEVHRMVQDLGFEVVYLSKLTFLAQADLFYQADIIVGEHGAGLANLLFSRPRTKVIEIFTIHWIAPCFYAIAKSAELEYHHFIAESDSYCLKVADAIWNSPIDKTLNASKATEYSIDAYSLREKIEAVMTGA